MFEKEAVEQANKKYLVPRVSNELDFARNRKYAEGFKDGAEFGYNKANEWHYVKDGNPKNENDILCRISKDEVVVGYYHSAKKRYITIDGQDIYNIIAWKEIVLPKESE